jgi:hypothetical protein
VVRVAQLLVRPALDAFFNGDDLIQLCHDGVFQFVSFSQQATGSALSA